MVGGVEGSTCFPHGKLRATVPTALSIPIFPNPVLRWRPTPRRSERRPSQETEGPSLPGNGGPFRLRTKQGQGAARAYGVLPLSIIREAHGRYLIHGLGRSKYFVACVF